MTDRFAIFGGNASGVYAAGRPGDYSGLGRAADVLQGRFYIDALEGFFDLKPFNLNVQYQQPQPIPFVDGEKYEYGYGASAWLETQSEIGIGIAYNRSVVPASAIVAGDTNGLDGDARAFATSFRWFGPKWYASLLYTDLENVEVTDQGRYIDATGVELYSQRQMTDRWWVIGGGNYLRPDDDEEDAGQFRIAYVVLGLRYTLRSFERMFYLEYKIDYGRTVDGRSGKDEVTIGIRWDF
jgi:hypothetical protein